MRSPSSSRVGRGHHPRPPCPLRVPRRQLGAGVQRTQDRRPRVRPETRPIPQVLPRPHRRAGVGIPPGCRDRAWASHQACSGSARPPESATGPVTPEGLAQIDGVVDCLSSDFLGVRTPDALSLHLQPVGGTVVLGHHIFANVSIRQKTEQAWQSWLRAVRVDRRGGRYDDGDRHLEGRHDHRVRPARRGTAGGARLRRLGRSHGPCRDGHALASDFTVFNFDRRGRGDSGDTLPYAIEREIEDIEAVIEAAGGSAGLGARRRAPRWRCIATASGAPVSKLALWEPPYFIDPTLGRRRTRSSNTRR